MKTSEWNNRRLALVAAQGLVLTVAVSSLVLLFTSSGDTLRQLRENVQWARIPLLAIPVLLSWFCNGTRFFLMCRCLGHRLPFRRAFSIAVSAEFGIAATPGGVGGTAIRLGFLKKSGVPFVHGVALMAADLFMDLLFFACIVPFALCALLQYAPSGLIGNPRDLHPSWLLVPLAPAALYAFRKPLYRMLDRQAFYRKLHVGVRIRFLQQKARRGFRQGRIAMGVVFKNHRGALALNFLLSAGQFTCRYSVLPLAIRMLGVPVDPLPLIVMQGLLYMVSMFVVAPGGGGSVEVLAALALPRFMPVSLVGVAILLWRLFTYHFYLLGGGAIFAATIRKVMRP